MLFLEEEFALVGAAYNLKCALESHVVGIYVVDIMNIYPQAKRKTAPSLNMTVNSWLVIKFPVRVDSETVVSLALRQM